MKNILVAVDMENGDQLLLDHAAKLAEKFDAKVWIVHVVAPDPDFVGFDAGPVYIRKTLADDLRKEHKTLQMYAESLSTKEINAEGLLVQGPTVQTIFDEADKLGTDILIIGSHKHNFIKRVFGDDVSRQIIGQSQIPMLIVPLAD
jgi:nucleotide-binding universal stress UspA family protein